VIIAAAIRQDGKVWTGRNHASIISAMINEGLPPPIKGEQGFIDDKRNFLDRHAAGEHAIACGQIEHVRWPGMGLDSVEIYPRRASSAPASAGEGEA
jgi:hypothetical protein